MQKNRIAVFVIVGLLVASVVLFAPIARASATGGKSYTLNNHEPDNQFITVPSDGWWFNPGEDEMLPNRNKLTAYGHYTGVALLPEEGGGVAADFDLEVYEDYDFEEMVVASYRGLGELEAVVMQQPDQDSESAFFARVLPYYGEEYGEGDEMNYVIESDSHYGDLYGDNPEEPGPLEVGETRTSALIAGDEGGNFFGSPGSTEGEPPLINVYSSYLYEGGNYDLSIPDMDESGTHLSYHIVKGNAAVFQDALASGEIHQDGGIDEEITDFTPDETGWYGVVVLNHNRENPPYQEYDILLSGSHQITAEPETRLISPGMSTEYDLTVTAEGAVDPIDLDYEWVGPEPDGVDVDFGKDQLYPEGDTVHETFVSVDTSELTGSDEYTLRISAQATDDAGTEDHAEVTLIVEDEENFYIDGRPAHQRVGVGGDFGYQINVSAINEFEDDVELSVVDVSPPSTELEYELEESTLTEPYPDETTLHVHTTPEIEADTYEITILGDGGGIQHTTTVELEVVPGLDASIHSPLEGELVSGEYTFQADASYTEGDIEALELTFGGNMSELGTLSVAYSSATSLWERDVNTEAYPDGLSTIKATATADDGSVYTSETVTFETRNTPPNPIIEYPSDHEYVSGDVEVRVETDDIVSEVKFRIDDQAWQPMTGGPPEWTSSWDTTTVSDGLHEITVEATDQAGLTGQSSTKIYVDNNPPSLEIVSPIEGETVQGTYMFQALAEDTVRVERVNLTVFGSTTTMIYNEVTGYYERSIRTSTVSDGDYTAYMQAWDAVGHESENRSVDFQVANTPPSMTVHSPESGEILQGTYTLMAEVESDFLETVEYRIDEGGWESMDHDDTLENHTAEWDTTAVPDGPYSLMFRAVDEVGHETEITRNVKVDNTPPTGAIIEPLGGEFISGTYTFRVSASDEVGLDSVILNVFNESYPASYNEVTGYYEYSLNTGVMDDGDYSVNATILDEAGWSYTTDDVNFSVDNTAPVVSIENPLTNSYVDGDVTIEADVTEIYLDSVEVRIDEGSWRDMEEEDPWTYEWDTTNYSEGPHRIDVRAVDEIGHSSMDTINVIVDNEVPAGFIASPYPSEYIRDSFTFQVSAEDENGIDQVVIDVFNGSYLAEYNTGTGMFEVTLITSAVEDGTYNLTATVEDKAGWETELGPVDFYVNNEAPTLSMLEPEPGTILSGDSDVRVEAEDEFLSEVRYRVDDGEWRTMADEGSDIWSDVLITSAFTDGEHTLTFEAIDSGGLSTSQSMEVIFDNTKPSGEIITPTDGTFVQERVAFQVNAEDKIGISEVMINFLEVEGEDASDIQDIGTRDMYYDYTLGSYVFEVATHRYTDGLAMYNATIVDEAGFQTDLEEVEFFIDNNPPDVEYIEPVQGSFVSDVIEISAEVEDGPFVPEVDYRINQRTWNDMERDGDIWTAEWDTTTIEDGEHTITVRARDDIGHVTLNEIEVTVDNHEPKIDILNPVSDQFIERDLTIQIDATDEVGIDYVMVDIYSLVREEPHKGQWTREAIYNPSSGYYEATLDTTLEAEDGYWNVTAYARDLSGKINVTDTVEFRVVNHDPELNIHSPQHGEYVSGDVRINATVEDAFPGPIYYSVDEGGWTPIIVPWETTGYSDGEHRLDIKATDQAGNEVVRTIRVTVINTEPEISILSPVEDQFVEDWFQFRVNARHSVEVDRVDADIFGSIQELTYDSDSGYYVYELDTRNIDDGTYNFSAKAVDPIGNEVETETITFNVDNNPPVIDIHSPQNGEYIRGVVDINVTAEDEFLRDVKYSVDDSGFVPITEELNTTRLSDGEHTITVRATDEAGHSTEREVTVVVDNLAPSIRMQKPRREEIISGTEEIEVFVDSEVLEITIEFTDLDIPPEPMESTADPNVYSYVLDTTELTGEDESGSFEALVRVEDYAGNEMDRKFEVLVDNAAPTIEMIEPVDSLLNETTVEGVTTFSLNVSSVSRVDSIQINIDGRGWHDMMLVENNTYMYQWDAEDEEDGDYTYVIRTEDEAGNAQQYSGSLSVENPRDYWESFQSNLPGIVFILVIILLIFLIYLGRDEVKQRWKRDEEDQDEEDEAKERTPVRSSSEKEDEGSEESELESEYKEKTLDELDMNDKLVGKLKGQGIATISDLTDKTEEDLLKIKGIGKKSKNRIEKELKKIGLSLKDKENSKKEDLMGSVMDADLPSDKD